MFLRRAYGTIRWRPSVLVRMDYLGTQRPDKTCLSCDASAHCLWDRALCHTVRPAFRVEVNSRERVSYFTVKPTVPTFRGKTFSTRYVQTVRPSLDGSDIFRWCGYFNGRSVDMVVTGSANNVDLNAGTSREKIYTQYQVWRKGHV